MYYQHGQHSALLKLGFNPWPTAGATAAAAIGARAGYLSGPTLALRKRNALIGGLTGATLGYGTMKLLDMYGKSGDPENQNEFLTRPEIAGALQDTVGGGLIGAIIGPGNVATGATVGGVLGASGGLARALQNAAMRQGT